MKNSRAKLNQTQYNEYKQRSFFKRQDRKYNFKRNQINTTRGSVSYIKQETSKLISANQYKTPFTTSNITILFSKTQIIELLLQ